MELKPYFLSVNSKEFQSLLQLIPEKEGEEVMPLGMVLSGVYYYSFKRGRLEQKTLGRDSKSWGKKGKFKEEYINRPEYNEHNIYLFLDRTKIKLNEIYFDNRTGELSGTMKTKKRFLHWNETTLNNVSIKYIF